MKVYILLICLLAVTQADLLNTKIFDSVMPKMDLAKGINIVGN